MNALDLLMLLSLFVPLGVAGPAILATARPLRLEFPEPCQRRAMALRPEPEPQPGELAPAEEIQRECALELAEAA